MGEEYLEYQLFGEGGYTTTYLGKSLYLAYIRNQNYRIDNIWGVIFEKGFFTFPGAFFHS